MDNETQLIVLNGVKATRTGLVFSDGINEVEWEEIGRNLGDVETAYQWMVGDWWIFGEQKYGARRHIVESPTWTGPAYGTCINCGTVCRAFKRPFRHGLLTFAHHQQIVPVRVSKPKLADEILDWCEEPLKKGKKKPRSVAKMKAEIKRCLNKHFEPMKKAKATPKDFAYIEFMGPIEQFAEHSDFDIPAIARVQIELFGEPEILSEDLAACKKVVNRINNFLKEVNGLCNSDQKSD
jgi:hypothetical protein